MMVHTYQKYLPERSDPRKLTDRTFSKPFPKNHIISPLYMDFHSYKSIPKTDSHKTFYIYRDPRDIITSWYFSVKNSHPPIGKIPEHRKELHRLSVKEGIKYSINYLRSFGLFSAMASWQKASNTDSRILFIRFEDLIGEVSQLPTMTSIMSHSGIQMTQREIKEILDKYHFKKMRKKGGENHSPYRRGISGDWKNYFSEETMQVFAETFPGLISKLGYHH